MSSMHGRILECEASSCVSRPIKAMIWINEIEFAKSTAELKTSNTIIGAKLQTNFEALDSKIASGIKKIINGEFRRRVFTVEEAAQKEKRLLTGMQVAWMIYEYFEVSDTDESVLYITEILKVELKNDHVQSCSTRDGTKPASR